MNHPVEQGSNTIFAIKIITKYNTTCLLYSIRNKIETIPEINLIIIYIHK